MPTPFLRVLLLALTVVGLAKLSAADPKVLYLYGSVADDGTIPAPVGQEFQQMRLNDTGMLGLSQFRDAIRAAGFVINEAYDAATTLNASTLNQYKVVILASNQKRFSASEKTAVAAWVNAGGGLIAWSDSAFGGNFRIVGASTTEGRDSDNDLMTQFGMFFMRDNAGGRYEISQYQFNHYINFNNKNAGLIFRGEGVSCVRVSPPSVMLAKLQAGGLGGKIQLSAKDPVFDPTRDAALAIASIGTGRVIGVFDRNAFWNMGAGTDISQANNRTYAQRLVQWAAGASNPLNAKINFQPASAANVPGWRVDSGAVYGLRGNGLTYGWLTDVSNQAFDRDSNQSPDQLRDTLIRMQKPEAPDATWEIAVPNGAYDVRLIVGDPTYFGGVHRLMAEGIEVVNFTPSATVRWADRTASTTVTDGLLTITHGAGSINAKICAVEIRQILGTAN